VSDNISEVLQDTDFVSIEYVTCYSLNGTSVIFLSAAEALCFQIELIV